MMPTVGIQCIAHGGEILFKPITMKFLLAMMAAFCAISILFCALFGARSEYDTTITVKRCYIDGFCDTIDVTLATRDSAACSLWYEPASKNFPTGGWVLSALPRGNCAVCDKYYFQPQVSRAVPLSIKSTKAIE